MLIRLRRSEPRDFHEQINFLFGSIGASRSTTAGENSVEVQGGDKKRRARAERNCFHFAASLLIFLMASRRKKGPKRSSGSRAKVFLFRSIIRLFREVFFKVLFTFPIFAIKDELNFESRVQTWSELEYRKLIHYTKQTHTRARALSSSILAVSQIGFYVKKSFSPR